MLQQTNDRVLICLPDGRWLALSTDLFREALRSGAELAAPSGASTAPQAPAALATADEIGEATHMSRATVYELAKAGVLPSGQRRWITRDTRKEVEVALASVSVAIAKDEYVAPDVTRTLQSAYDHWWRVSVTGSDNKRGKPLSPGSQGFYAGLWSSYFVAPEERQPSAREARFALRRLRSITQAEVAEWKEALGLPVGPRTVLAAFQMLSTLFEHARRFGWAVRNPCEFIHAPSYGAQRESADHPDDLRGSVGGPTRPVDGGGYRRRSLW